MLRAHVAQQRQLLHMAWKITLPQTDYRQVSPRCPFLSGNSVPLGSSVSSGSSIGLQFTQFLLLGHLRLDGSANSESVSRWAAPSRRHLCLVMFSICIQYRQLLLVRQLSLEGSSESASQGIITSGSVLSKTAIFPKNEGRKREISNESTRGSSLHEANV